MKKAMLAILLLAVTAALCACGGGGDKQFKVEYVGSASVMSTDLYIQGTYEGDGTKLAVQNAFEGCTVKEFAFANPENVTMSGTEEGHLKFDGGIILTLEDADGVSHSVTVKEESVFDVTENGGSMQLKLPKE